MTAPTPPPGTYTAKPISANHGATPKGTMYFRVLFGILAGEQQHVTAEWTVWLTDKAKPHAEKSLNALGWDGSWEPVGIDMTRQVDIVVEHETYPPGSGKVYARVRWVNPTSGAPVVVEESDDDKIPF